MLVGNTVHGNASAAIRQEALRFITWLGTQDATIAQLLARQDIRLTVAVQQGVGDQRTVVEWESPNTAITVTVKFTAGDSAAKVKGDLLHELILHAAVATTTHLTAVNGGQQPRYATTDDDIEAEESAEHADVARWLLAARLGQNESRDLLEKVVADCASHDKDVAIDLLRRLVRGQVLTGDEANELHETFIDSEESDGGDGGDDGNGSD